MSNNAHHFPQLAKHRATRDVLASLQDDLYEKGKALHINFYNLTDHFYRGLPLSAENIVKLETHNIRALFLWLAYQENERFFLPLKYNGEEFGTVEGFWDPVRLEWID